MGKLEPVTVRIFTSGFEELPECQHNWPCTEMRSEKKEKSRRFAGSWETLCGTVQTRA